MEIATKKQKQYKKEIDYKFYNIYDLNKGEVNLITQTIHNAKG